MKHMLRIAALVVAFVALVAAMPAATAFINPDVVKGTSLFEGYGASTHIGSRRLFAWTNEMTRESDLDAFVEANGGAVTRINADRTNAFVGGFDSGTDRVIFQQVSKNDSDLFLYDISARTREPLRALNDGHWQWNPSIDTDRSGTPWVAYGVNRFGSPSAKWRLYLVNMDTSERTLLDETTNRCGCLFPGTVAYPWVTWSIGADATTWRYNIRSGEREPLLATDRDEYSAATTPNGTTYIAQGGDRCGVNARLYRVARDGSSTLLLRFAPGREPANLSVDHTAPHDRLFYDRRICLSGRADILRLRRADVLHGIGGTTARGAVSSPRGVMRSASTPDASPRTR
ncbi:MAG: hypothetical protein ACRDGK_05190 [Actinomycetota bacterium]